MVRILIVDDQKLVREGIKILLENRTEIEIVGDIPDGESALKEIKLLQPDIVLLDIDMPGMDGLTLANIIRSRFPLVKIIMLSSHEEKSYVQQATESGAKGYLLKNASSQELEWSIKLVHRGYSAIKSELLEQQLIYHKKPEIDLKLDVDFQTDDQQSSGSKTILSEEDRANLDKLELLLAKKESRKKYSHYKEQQKQRKFWFHGVRLTQIKKTIMSFEFKLLVFIILFCLGFLVIVALS
ncbi:response regulator [Waterburya agarophytonicola K14]|uniref:Response regulator n=1 Tax=Waterburya agarophytonicola KI4 TaxID=2874699 RepID=A0A964BT23_9CYAN|nr:response regulator transcription factor [Waterburya agarophytonicola]MCC0177335.1 response regulator [Waterburya agarophytonicola KI4]